MKNLYELINIYRTVLNSAWGKIQVVATGEEGESLLNDWKQVNWELLVECNLPQEKNIVLEPYGEGADYYGDSSRIIKPDALPTHTVCCNSEENVEDRLTGDHMTFPTEGFDFECFVTMRDGWYYEEPPFDCILVIHDDKQFVFKIEDIRFDLRKIN